MAQPCLFHCPLYHQHRSKSVLFQTQSFADGPEPLGPGFQVQHKGGTEIPAENAELYSKPSSSFILPLLPFPLKPGSPVFPGTSRPFPSATPCIHAASIKPHTLTLHMLNKSASSLHGFVSCHFPFFKWNLYSFHGQPNHLDPHHNPSHTQQYWRIQHP